MENNATILDKAVKIGIVVGTLIVGLSVAYYLVVYIPQRDKAKVEQQKQEQIAKDMKDSQIVEQQKKEYISKRKSDCMQVYKTEDDKWNNVESYEYVEKIDRCYVLYKSQGRQKDRATCDKISENIRKIDMVDKEIIANLEWVDCMNNLDRKPF
jgi:hypothetical protein